MKKNNLFLSIVILFMPIIAMDVKENFQLYFKTYKYSDNDIALKVYDKDRQHYTFMHIGCICYNFKTPENTVFISHLNVNEEYQNMGIGSQLFLKALHDAKTKNMKTVTWVSMRKSLNFYERFGAKISPLQTDLYGVEFDFDRDGCPEENLNQYYLKKEIARRQNDNDGKQNKK